MDEVVSLKNIRVDYDALTALEGVTLSVKQKDFLGIIGPNGGGKSTLLKVILGLVKPTAGEVKVLGLTPKKARKFVGYVPQANPLDREFPINVWDTVLMGRLGQLGYFKNYRQEDKKITTDALKTIEMLDFKNYQFGKLSGGQKQRVLIARALTTKPKLLLLDEPTASVDTHTKAGFYDLLEKLKERMAIILVSHDIGVISSYVEKIACLNQKLFYHDTKEIKQEELEAVYHCPVELIAHGVPHRVMRKELK